MTMIRKRGLLSRAGEYRDKGITLTAADFAAAAAAFAPVQNDLEHKPTILSGHLGSVLSVAPGPNPEELYGEVEVPDWLEQLRGDAEFKVSLAWDPNTKRIVGNALVLNPRITDAAVFSAFAAFSASQGTAGTNEPPTGGQRSNSMSFGQRVAAWFNNDRKGDAPELTAADLAEIAPAQFATSTVTPMNGITSGATMGFSALTPLATTPDPELAALKARVAASEQENIRLRQEGIAQRAASFYAAEFAAHRVVPAEEEAVIAAFTQAATDDATHGVVTFSEGVTKSRVDLLRAQYAARPAHVLTQEMVTAAGLTEESARALFNQQTTARAGAEKKPTEERRRALLESSPLGLAALNGRQN